jgi:hypothetical protein
MPVEQTSCLFGCGEWGTGILPVLRLMEMFFKKTRFLARASGQKKASDGPKSGYYEKNIKFCNNFPDLA